MGRGCALEAVERYPDIRRRFAGKLKTNGNVVQGILKDKEIFLISFPVKHHWRQPADINLIRKSAKTLREKWLEHGNGCEVVIPRPGCGNGQLEWAAVKPILEEELPEDEFKVITF
jgi:hypothetical protein